MKENRKTIWRIFYFIFFLLIILSFLSCGPPRKSKRQIEFESEMTEIEGIIWDINHEKERINKEKALLDQERLEFSQSVNEWEKNWHRYRESELTFIKSLDDNQLEAYALYEESKKADNIPKTQLYLRKLSKSITDKQKSDLLDLFTVFEDLIEITDTLNNKQNELTNKQAILLEAIEKNEKKRDRMLNYLAMRSNQQYIPSGPSPQFVEVQNALEKWHQDIQQRQQLRSTNNALMDIAAAIRGY